MNPKPAALVTADIKRGTTKPKPPTVTSGESHESLAPKPVQNTNMTIVTSITLNAAPSPTLSTEYFTFHPLTDSAEHASFQPRSLDSATAETLMDSADDDHIAEIALAANRDRIISGSCWFMSDAIRSGLSDPSDTEQRIAMYQQLDCVSPAPIADPTDDATQLTFAFLPLAVRQLSSVDLSIQRAAVQSLSQLPSTVRLGRLLTRIRLIDGGLTPMKRIIQMMQPKADIVLRVRTTAIISAGARRR
jgi:hypothetical protein